LFVEADLDPETIVARAFPDLAILAPMPHGSPMIEGESFSHMVMPGDDNELIALASRSGLIGIAACTSSAESPAPQRPLTLDVHTASRWGLTAPSWSVAFRAVGDDRILRVNTAGRGTQASVHRVFGMNVDDARAVALVQRASETWARDCATRADTASPPGKVYAKDPAFRRAVLAIVAVADAARDRRAHTPRRPRLIARLSMTGRYAIGHGVGQSIGQPHGQSQVIVKCHEKFSADVAVSSVRCHECLGS